MDRKIFLDEDVLRVQNEVRRFKDEQQRLHDGDVDDKVQREYSSRADSDYSAGQSRGNFLQDTSAPA